MTTTLKEEDKRQENILKLNKVYGYFSFLY